MSLSLTSPAFTDRGELPARYSCEVKGREVSPPLSWSGVPAAAKSLALIVDDPDVPDPKAPQRTWVHWGMQGHVLAHAELVGTYQKAGKRSMVGAILGR